MSTDRSGILMNASSDSRDAEYALRWLAPSYMKVITGALVGLRDHGKLCDVTLSCQGRQVQAHRILLAACSPYFKSVFEDNPSTHPVIVFRDFQHEDLLDLVHFIYRGEVDVPKHRLASFFSTAQLLEIQGLAGLRGEPQKEHIQVSDTCTGVKRRKLDDDNDEFETENIPEDADVSDTEIEPSPSDLSKPKNEHNLSIKTEHTYDSTSDQIKENTQEGDKFRCQLCWKGFKHPTSLTLHKDSHTGKTQCPICHRSFSRSYDMRSHLMKIHQDQPVSEIKPKISKPPCGNAT